MAAFAAASPTKEKHRTAAARIVGSVEYAGDPDYPALCDDGSGRSITLGKDPETGLLRLVLASCSLLFKDGFE